MKGREKRLRGKFWDQMTLNAQGNRDYFTEVIEWHKNGHFPPSNNRPIPDTYYATASQGDLRQTHAPEGS